MRAGPRLWLALGAIAISLMLGFLLTRLLSGPGSSGEPARPTDSSAKAASTASPSPEVTLQSSSGIGRGTPTSLPEASSQLARPAVTVTLAPSVGQTSPLASRQVALSSATLAATLVVGETQSPVSQQAAEAAATVATPEQRTVEGTTRAVPLVAEATLAEGSIGQIRIAKIGVEAPIYELSWHLAEIQGQTLAEWDTHPTAVGHHRGSGALGGEGNCVLSGHSRAGGTGAGPGVFQRIEELEPDDPILVTDVSGQEYAYVVQEVVKLSELGSSLEERRANAAYMAPSEEARLTLITCWPDWAYTHRLIVVARRA